MTTSLLLRSIVATVICSSPVRAAEHFNLVVTSGGESTAIALGAGDTAKLKFTSHPGVRMVATMGTSTFDLPSFRELGSLGTYTYTANPIKIVGLGSFKVAINSATGLTGFATFEVNRAGTASNATAIPLEAGTTWQVILEASTDLVNWTPVAPGDYPSASPQRS
jgi:hypothetical protein